MLIIRKTHIFHVSKKYKQKTKQKKETNSDQMHDKVNIKWHTTQKYNKTAYMLGLLLSAKV